MKFYAIALLVVFLIACGSFTFWKRRGVPQYNFSVLLLEIVLGLIPYRSISKAIQKVYNDFQDERYCGVYQFTLPGLMIRDCELIKQLTIKDFDHFADHKQILAEDSEPMWDKNLFALKGDRWKDMRATLSPSFTSSKMKMMFHLISEYAKQFIEYFEKQPGTVVLEMKDTFTRFTNDIIATSAFGVHCDSVRNPYNEFYLMGKKLTNSSGFINNVKMLFLVLFPRVAKYFRLGFFPKKASKFFCNLVKENIENREKNGIVRPDMIHLLMEARKGRLNNEQEPEDDGEKRVKHQLTYDDITAQALIFFFAGFDSVSTLMCFMAYELAINVDVQEQLQNEIDEVLAQYNDGLTYEALSKMKYLDMVVSETLRKWPPGVVSDRVCVKPYTIKPVKTGEEPLHIEKGQILWIPIFGLHRDVKYFTETERFDPERFNEENKSKIQQNAYLPFGIGPRSCIANRFALMETKVLYFYLLAKFNIVVVDKTVVPLKVAKSSFQLTSQGGFWLGLTSRNLN
ncbi:hypothetical protein RN001_011391 [Aquatica leii]|uniref:Cytochrome P450 n=1 Tax=Aquatica leii TaxID=1421715 RepID=A0AAN7Q413_9COLE|nr:hypothetical protein RN001_011391 [Aquatica leii]